MDIQYILRTWEKKHKEIHTKYVISELLIKLHVLLPNENMATNHH